MAIIGYIRVSSNKQTLEHQEFEIKKFAKSQKIKIDRWVEEKISSRKPLAKRQLGQLLNELKEGDILIACEISRLGRSLLEVMRILESCLNKNCQVWTIKENYRLGNDIQSKVMAFAFGLSAEIERNLISQRTKSSLENVRASGKRLGRPFAAQSKKLKLSKNTKRIKDLLDQGVSITHIARLVDVQRMTVYRFIQRMGWGMNRVEKHSENKKQVAQKYNLPKNNDFGIVSNYRLENWKRLRAFDKPGFLRSTTRLSRVKKPAFFKAVCNSGSNISNARLIPWRKA